MAAIITHGGNAQGIALVTLGQCHDLARHGGAEQQGAAAFRRGVENFFQIFAEAHVEHFVRFIQHHCAQCGQLQRAAFQMVTQAARCSDHDLRAATQCAAFLGCIHPADASGDPGACLAIQPHQFAADLQGQFASRRDNQSQRRIGLRHGAVFSQQLFGHGKAESHGFARAGLGRYDQVAASGFCFDYSGLYGSGFFVAAFGQRFAKKWREIVKIHGTRIIRGRNSDWVGNGPGLSQVACEDQGLKARYRQCRPVNSCAHTHLSPVWLQLFCATAKRHGQRAAFCGALPPQTCQGI